MPVCDKEIAVKFCLTDSTTCLTHYMMQGLSLDMAKSKYLYNRSIDINKAAVSCKNRSESSVVLYLAIKYLSESSAVNFLDDIKLHLSNYSSVAHLGLEYGQSKEGIMDYIEATNTYVNGGLSTYTFNIGRTFDECRIEFKNYLVYGIEPQEFNSF